MHHAPLKNGQRGAGPVLAVVGVKVADGLQVVATQQRPRLLGEAEDLFPRAQLLLRALVHAHGKGVVGVRDVHEEHKPAGAQTMAARSLLMLSYYPGDGIDEYMYVLFTEEEEEGRGGEE